MGFRGRVLTSGALTALGYLSGVHAPIAIAQDADPAAEASIDAEAAEAAPEAARSFDTVVVTAQRRSQRLQDVPVSVTALSGSQAESQGIVSTHDLAQAVTGMTITESGAYVQPFIRGVGSTVTNLGEQGSTATYIDGVYMPAVHGQFYDLANIESVQVLKGPQGTLFGRNANSGAILITTRMPQDTPEGRFEASYGNYNAVGVRGVMSGPLTENVAASIAGNYDAHDGWYRNLYQGGADAGEAERYALRGGLLVSPAEDLELFFSADVVRSDDAGPILVQPINGYLGYMPGDLLPQDDYDFIGNENVGFLSGQNGISARVTYSFDTMEFVSTSAYREYYSESINYDSDTTPFRYTSIGSTDEGSNITQEFQLNSTGDGNFSWVTGVFYMRQDANYAPLRVDSATATTLITADQQTEAYAAYADGSYTLGDFEITAGLRYSYEDKTYDGWVNGNPVAVDVSKSWDAVTPRFVLAYKPSDALMLYGSYTQGFKSGTFNANALSSVPVDPETVDAYEIGLKLLPASNITLNTAVFYYETSDLQVQALNPANNLIQVANAAEVESSGVDIEFAWLPTDALSIRAGASYLNSEFASFPNAQAYIPAGGMGDGNTSVIIDATGNKNVRSPEWTFNLAADYTIELANGGSVVPSFNIYNSSSFFWEVGNRIEQDAYTVLNGQVTWNLPGDQLSLSLWGRNLTDEVYFRNVSASGQADRQVADAPMTYGIRIGYNY